uniref:Uncharacterized protein n=1 Tax=Psilocybe cubensis TaxID=181762 RepID=A0A8H8CDL8_PSICU
MSLSAPHSQHSRSFIAKGNGAAGIETMTLVSIFVQSILYGLFIVLFIASTAILLRKSRLQKKPINKPMLTASLTMFILATVHLAADLRRVLDAFVRHAEQPGGTKGYLSLVSEPTYVLQSTAYGTQTLVGDAFMLYRLHLVWNGDMKIVVPLLVCYIASAGVGLGAVQGFARSGPHPSDIFIGSLGRWSISFFSLTLFTNLTCTVLIALKIWWMHKRTKSIVSGVSVLPAMVIIIESGALYSAVLIILLTTYAAGSYSQYIALDAVTQIIGITFSLVIIRVGLKISDDRKQKQGGRLTTLVFGGSTEARTMDDPESDYVIDLRPFRGQIDIVVKTEEHTTEATDRIAAET